MTVQDVQQLRRLATELRLNVVRMMGANKAHHFGGSMSAADIVTALYFYKMRYDPANPTWPERDRFILSKGHCVPVQYAALAMRGVFPIDELLTLKQMGTRLQGHPAAHLLPGIEGCTGSLGQGLSFANGMALAGRIQGLQYRVYCLMGDGETQEGQVWEAAMTSSRHCLGNLTAIIDANGLKAMDEPSCAKLMEPIAGRWASFGWRVREIDGHDMEAICRALDWAEESSDAPSLIVAHTIKGKGISFIEGQAAFHNAPFAEQQVADALAELESTLQGLQEEAL
ncbi:MAG: transketolase [Anaerolineae bacterium]|jgi:transketolase